MITHKHTTFIVLDLETGGIKSSKHAITEIGALAINGKDFSKQGQYCNMIIPNYDEKLTYEDEALRVTGLSLAKLTSQGVKIQQAFAEFLSFIVEETSFSDKKWKAILCGHNIGFDVGFLIELARTFKVDLGVYFDGETLANGQFIPFTIDTQRLSYISHGDDPSLVNNKLISVAHALDVELNGAHRAMADVHATAEILIQYFQRLRAKPGVEEQVKSQTKLRLRFPL